MNMLPTKMKLYELFEDHSRIVVQASELLLDAVRKGGSHLKVAAVRIAQIEQQGDELIHETLTNLNRSFITPIDPEDIHALGTRLDDVLDGLEDAAYRISAYHLDSIPPNAIRFCEIIHSCAEQIRSAVEALARSEDVRPFCVQIHTLENEADELDRESIENLLNGGGDPITTIKLKEIFDFLEETCDRCEDVADSLGNIVLKNA
jgi:predicted phosphate transport protein (TIGR00153 family)